MKRIRYGLGFIPKQQVKPNEAKIKSTHDSTPHTSRPPDDVITEQNLVKKNENMQPSKQKELADDSTDIPKTKCRKCGKVIHKSQSKSKKIKTEISSSQNSLADKQKQRKKSVSFMKEMPKKRKKSSGANMENDTDSQNIILTAIFYRIKKDENGQEEWIETEKVDFLLERMEWMNFPMSEKTKKFFLCLLDMKKNFKTSLSNLEKNIHFLTTQVEYLITNEVAKYGVDSDEKVHK